METITIEQLENCIYDNKKGYTVVRVLNFTQIDDRFIVVETDKKLFNDCYFQTIDLEHNNTIGIVSNNRDKQILITLGYKYEGCNSKFFNYADKMLEIDSFGVNEKALSV